MIQCPSCYVQVHVDDDFGLAVCENCGAQFFPSDVVPVNKPAPEPESVVKPAEPFVDETGAIEATVFEFAEPEREIDDRTIATHPPASAAEIEHIQEIGDLSDRNVHHQAPVEDEAAQAEAPYDDLFGEPEPEHQSEPEPEAEPEPAPATGSHAHSKPDIFADPEDSSETVYRPPGPASDSPDLSDIAKFGNSDASSARDGALRYTLTIEGIDTADVRASLREALTDRKFLWDIDQLLRTVRDGQVLIPNIAASKAHMLISRLRALPVTVRWEQHAVHQA